MLVSLCLCQFLFEAHQQPYYVLDRMASQNFKSLANMQAVILKHASSNPKNPGQQGMKPTDVNSNPNSFPVKPMQAVILKAFSCSKWFSPISSPSPGAWQIASDATFCCTRPEVAIP